MVYPVVFGLKKHVNGNGFLAEVTLNCTAIFEFDEDEKEWWALGVQPYLNLKVALVKVLFDSAQLTDSYDAFEADVKQIMGACHAEELKRWEEAREAIKKGAAVEAGFEDLPRVEKPILPSVEVGRVDNQVKVTFVPSDNLVDNLAAAA
jgi:hypothetical protein